ncbi:TonB-dependent receptor [Sphingomonas sp. R-74633]|uniref:TonB-dependent receptor n=1 Tax=Sphingomonas sp. R-74633 TaxID=2751188 RepID=UPI0015D14646|nr:TonB-dependent receptor [Sphingomonas sp. R-74633]NYT40736.1 TonB-dependent receptor [Sphingomonas sp. R-74633]
MFTRTGLTCAASLLALAVTNVAQAQTAEPQNTPTPDAAASAQESTSPEIVVTGIRSSLTRAAEIKQNAVQVVDSIVAQDIGKLPDPTTAAALQRVPGIQVSFNRNNELGDVRVRGLPDVLTTINGREVFSTTGRKFDLGDLPAEALARVDVYKSQSPDLIEGGLAGVIDMQLNKPFNFKNPTVVLSARGNYGKRADKLSPQFGGLATDRWDTGIGEIGLLVNATWSRNDYERDQTILSGIRSSAATPLSTPGLLIPNIIQNFPEEGKLERTQVNAAFQWQISPNVEAYVDGLYTRSHDIGAHYGANIQPFTTGTTISNVTASTNCFDAYVTATGQNNTATPAPVPQHLCYLKSATFNNIVSNQTTQARDITAVNKSIAGGFKVEQEGVKANLDVSYQTSRNDRTLIIQDVGQRLTSLTLTPDVDGIAQMTVPGGALLSSAGLSMRNSFQQQFGLTEGNLFAAKLDGEVELGGILSNLKMGARYARRAANSYQLQLNTAVPGGNIGTATEAKAVLVSASGLPADFLALGSPAPGINGGTAFYVPNPDFLLSDAGQDALRTYVGLPKGRPGFQKDRQFNASEKTIASFAELNYKIPLGDSAAIDGIVGARLTRTDRDITTFVASTTGGVTTYRPVSASTTDTDFLPTVTARLKFDNGIQARLGYAKSIRRPEFGDLNPAVTTALSNNPFVQNSGSAGNPDLKEQKSDSYDATLEYYFKGGYVAVAGYYRKIKDRVLNGAKLENIGGIDYNVTRPRNLGAASLKGVEVSGQYFFDFLPGPLSGLGAQVAFTLADSEIEGNDPLAGNPLQGVSKYNYTTGLLYEKYGISGRLVYTYRSKYFDSDQTGSISVRPVGNNTLLSYVRPAGRLDFNIGYDITQAIRIDVGGTNVLHAKTRDYLGQSFLTFEGMYDETTYSVGVRVRL